MGGSLCSVRTGHSLKLTRLVATGIVAAATLFGTLACGNGDERSARAQSAERSAMSEAEEIASRAASIPATGLWSEEHLLDRLVRAGVAPRRMEEPPAGPRWMPGEPRAFLAGGGEVYVWIFADSSARRSVTDGLDPRTGTPTGETVPFVAPMLFLVQNNLAAFVTGGTARNQERIALALQAGLPVSAPGRAPPLTPRP